MSKPTIDIARALVQKRKFADAIDLLKILVGRSRITYIKAGGSKEKVIFKTFAVNLP